MPADLSVANSDGVAFLISAGLVFELTAACCSSPQTTELNANKRSKTLMKWVTIGLAESALFVGIAAYLDSPRRGAILAGGALAGMMMYAGYAHARKAGLASSAPATEGW
jgi:hypothetical protein